MKCMKFSNSCNYSCNNNNDENDNCNDSNYYETACSNVGNFDDCYEDCSCGFTEESQFPVSPLYAQSYVPTQKLNKTFTPCIGLKMGTIYPELVSPYSPGQSMEFIQYLKDNNEIKEGCNKC